MLVLLFGRESHIFFCFSVWAVIRLESVVIVGGFKVHVTYTYGAITRVYLYIYIFGKIIAGNTIYLSHFLLCLVYATIENVWMCWYD